ncbi:MAG: competence/damage-inducible protein A [Candidatus Omnitrophica bacterium]|nr:competence/damage-inducible protein A [Candidatus Omnitrophota bacterium]
MNPIHLILIGDELLSGKRRDLHLQTIAQSLALHGARVASCEVIHDQAGEEEACVRRYLAPGAVIVTTGGLGPTLDDLTREGLSKATGVGLREEPELWEDLRHRYERMGRPISSSNRSQALVPEHGTWFHNDHGTAPGLVFEPPDWPDCTVIALPGPPWDWNPMWHEQALPYLIHRYQWPSPPHSILLRFAQMGSPPSMRKCARCWPPIRKSSCPH